MSVNTKMTAIADAIRAKTGGTAALSLDAMAEAIAGLGSGLSDDIEEINYGTYEATSTYSGSSTASIKHGLSGRPHLFAFVIDMDYSVNIPEVPFATSIIGVATLGALKLEGTSSEYRNACTVTRLSTNATTIDFKEGLNAPTDTEAFLGRYIKYGTVYRWIAVRFKQNEQTL